MQFLSVRSACYCSGSLKDSAVDEYCCFTGKLNFLTDLAKKVPGFSILCGILR